MITQSQSEFALHIRAVLGLPLDFAFFSPGASAAYKADFDSVSPSFEVDESLFDKDGFIRIFGKPEAHKGRRMAVYLTFGENSKKALQKAKDQIKKIKGVK